MAATPSPRLEKGLPPAVARIFEREERAEPSSSQKTPRRHRLGPLRENASPSPITLRDMHCSSPQGFKVIESLAAAAADARAEEGGVVSTGNYLVAAPPPPPGPKNGRRPPSAVPCATSLAPSVYLAPVIPRCPQPPSTIRLGTQRPQLSNTLSTTKGSNGERKRSNGNQSQTSYRDTGENVCKMMCRAISGGMSKYAAATSPSAFGKSPSLHAVVVKEQAGTSATRQKMMQRPLGQERREAEASFHQNILAKDLIQRAVGSGMFGFLVDDILDEIWADDCEMVELMGELIPLDAAPD
eukprot:TRINITY_DN109748_c0_g1_i1.p1 TRINITY_DN109748_c0_g1~~TRINITY_DN109748_c0_g1_i1.p1  ORF type:complete len:298 (+),score=53.79 TRINITY_DN109748_c0_g1_i1:85-978(+)